MVDMVQRLQQLNGLHFVQGSLRDTRWIADINRLAQDGDVDRAKFVIKLPWAPLEASTIARDLRSSGWAICATAVYSLAQYVAATETHVEYVAMYFDRLRQANEDAANALASLSGYRDRWDGPEILVASLKSFDDVEIAFQAGADHVTLPERVFLEFFATSFPHDDMSRFEKDFTR